MEKGKTFFKRSSELKQKKSFHINNLTIVLGSVVLILLIALIFIGYKFLSGKEGKEVDTVKYLAYTSEEYGYSFKYPEGWNLEVVKLKKNEDYNAQGKEYSVRDEKGNDTVKMIYKHSSFASYGDLELVVLSRDDNWSIEIEASKSIYEKCGGETGLGKIDSKYKTLTVGDRYKAVRYNFEEGKYRIIDEQGKHGDEEVPVTQVIQSYFEETLDNGFDTYYLPLCISLTDIPLSLSIEYVSNIFTYENMNNGFKADTKVLKELDSVVESISFNKESDYFNTLK